MKLINPKAEVLIQPPGLDGIYKQIEIAGRTCYKSEDKITEASAVDFVKRMVTSNHTAMLEHGAIYLKSQNGQWPQLSLWRYNNPYSRVLVKDEEIYVTTNLRVIQENNWFEDLQFLCEPTEFHKKRITLKFITDRGVSHELVRHRVFSFAQESTRYCNYTKDKFESEITFIIPSWLNDLQEGVYNRTYNLDGATKKTNFGFVGPKEAFLDSINRTEHYYMSLISMGHTPQEARQVLPNALKTEIVMTGFISDWKHFFDLRYFGKTGKPHPDMEYLAGLAKEQFEEHGLWHLIEESNGD